MAYDGRLSIEDRITMFARYITEHETTVRAVANRFGYSKSTVHKDITARLFETDKELYEQVAQILKNNKQTRHIRGGNATKIKYAELKIKDDKLKGR